MDNLNRFESVLYALPLRIRKALLSLTPQLKLSCEEIRLRSRLPVAITIKGETLFVKQNGQICRFASEDLLHTEADELKIAFKLLCNGSAFAHTTELKNGFVIMKNGSRAGVCGTLTESGMRDISSINIRIAREVFGCADHLLSEFNGGLLIAGPPASGKTTLLRDLCRQLSNGFSGKSYRVAVIDSRGELSGSSYGEVANDLGLNTDVLLSYDKADGIEIALRTMFPDIIAFDEIGTSAELKRVSESFCAGVEIITTAHIGKAEELMTRSVTRKLLKSGAIKKVALLEDCHSGKIKIYNTRELIRGAVFKA